MGRLIVVAGGQYGSEAKGHTTAYLGRREEARDNGAVGVRVAGPNAGHIVIDRGERAGIKGHEWKLRTVPVLAVSNPDAMLVIAAGSEIDLEVLVQEVAELDAAGYNVSGRLLIDGQATVLEDHHKQTEADKAMQDRLGSTAKGIGAARASRVMREAKTWGELTSRGMAIDSAAWLRSALAMGTSVIIEGTQGYGLGLHAGEYPYCTSSNCRVIDFLAMAGLAPWDPEVVVGGFEPWLVLRTRPIRVAGNSGRLEGETTWQALGLPEEKTTVTNKTRRVGEWDGDLARRAVVANGGAAVKVSLTMLDQQFPEVAGVTKFEDLTVEAVEWVAQKQFEIGAPICLVGTSPDTMVDLEGRI